MKRVKLTCPFTGLTFYAIKNELDGSLTFKNPITNEQLTCNYNWGFDTLMIPARFFEETEELVTQSEAAYMLGITRQRVSYIAKTQVIQPLRINDKIYFRKSDVLEYKRNRKIGAPTKEESENGR